MSVVVNGENGNIINKQNKRTWLRCFEWALLFCVKCLECVWNKCCNNVSPVLRRVQHCYKRHCYTQRRPMSHFRCIFKRELSCVNKVFIETVSKRTLSRLLNVFANQESTFSAATDKLLTSFTRCDLIGRWVIIRSLCCVRLSGPWVWENDFFVTFFVRTEFYFVIC